MEEAYFRLPNEQRTAQIEDLVQLFPDNEHDSRTKEITKIINDYRGVDHRILPLLVNSFSCGIYESVKKELQLFNHEVFRYCSFASRSNYRVGGMVALDRLMRTWQERMEKQQQTIFDQDDPPYLKEEVA